MGRKHHPVYARGMLDLCEVERAFEETFIIYLNGPRWTGGYSVAEEKKSAAPLKRGSLAPITRSRPRLRAGVSAIRPSVPRMPSSAKARDGLKHFGITYSSIYKERASKGNERAANRAGYAEAYNRESQEITAEERATAAAEYAEGGKSDYPERVVWRESNIADTYEKRVDFFRKTADAVAFKGDAYIEIDIRGYEADWANIRYMPKDVRKVYNQALQNGGRAKRIFNNTEEAFGFSKAKAHQKVFKQTLVVKNPPNGLVCSTVVVPIPHELSRRGKRRYAEKVTRFFAKRGIPYQAVIHEPVAGKNDARNWHMHINYWPFECHKREDGTWSFEKELYKSNCGHWRERRRVAPRRLEETKPGKGWVKAMKIYMCEQANASLREEGLRPRFTTQTNLERGLEEAEKPRGPKLSARLKKGEVTEEEIDLRLEAWRRRRKRLLERAKSLFQRRYGARLSAAGVSGSNLDDALELAKQADQLGTVALLADLQERKIRSGLEGVIADQQGVLKATVGATGSAKKERQQASEILSLCRAIDGVLQPLLSRSRAVKAAAQAEARGLVENLNDIERIAKERAKNQAIELKKSALAAVLAHQHLHGR